jgi:hypothetical protein
MLQDHPRGLRNPLLVVIVRCWKMMSDDSQSEPSLGRETRWRERSSPQDSLDRMSGMTLQRCSCCIGSVGRRLRYDRGPSDRLIHPGSLRNCSSTILQRLPAVLTTHCLLETVGQDLDRDVSLRNRRTRTYNYRVVSSSPTVVRRVLQRSYPKL